MLPAYVELFPFLGVLIQNVQSWDKAIFLLQEITWKYVMNWSLMMVEVTKTCWIQSKQWNKSVLTYEVSVKKRTFMSFLGQSNFLSNMYPIPSVLLSIADDSIHLLG